MTVVTLTLTDTPGGVRVETSIAKESGRESLACLAAINAIRHLLVLEQQHCMRLEGIDPDFRKTIPARPVPKPIGKTPRNR